ncbi:MAG: phytanoyl-CoA dioxygenase family protein, partial [Planctomycetaceae bacterium]
MLNHSNCAIQGRSIPSDVLGELTETKFHPHNTSQLQQRMHDDGYLFLRGVIDVPSIDAARREVFGRLAEVGEIEPPPHKGIATGTSRRQELVGDLGQFWQSVSEGPALRHISHGRHTHSVMDALLGEPSRPHDYIFLRPGVVGRATNLHYDYPFFARGSKRIYTVWTAIGEIPPDEGTLVVVEGSHHFHDLIDPILKIDYESKYSPQVAMTDD